MTSEKNTLENQDLSSFMDSDYMACLTRLEKIREEVEWIRRCLISKSPILSSRISSLGLSERSANCMDTADIRYLCELVQKSDADLLRIKHFGRGSLQEIKSKLANVGLSLGMNLINLLSREEMNRINHINRRRG